MWALPIPALKVSVPVLVSLVVVWVFCRARMLTLPLVEVIVVVFCEVRLLERMLVSCWLWMLMLLPEFKVD